MHVNAKKIAFGGLMLAFTEVCIALGSVIETNTLFLLAAASYLVGIVVREMEIRTGAAFYLAGVLLGMIVSPNKVYVISYAGMGFYILAVEFTFRWLGKKEGNINRTMMFWTAKYIIFNVMFIPMVYAFQEVLFAGEISVLMLAGVLAAGQLGLFIYDRAYEYVQANIWNKFRRRL